jgi:hypothetical protein
MRTQNQATSFMIRWLLFFCSMSLVYVGLRYRMSPVEQSELPFQVAPSPYPVPENIFGDTAIGPGARLVVHHEEDRQIATLMVDIGDDRNPLAILHGKDLKGLTLYADHWLVLEFKEDSKDS